MKKLTEIEKAYMAGIIDGEGCIRIAKYKTKNGVNYKQFVCVTIKQFELLAYLKEITGIGCIYKYKKGFKENWCPIHRWQILCQQARDLLKATLPYLKVKKQVAEVVLSMPVHLGTNKHSVTHKPQQEMLFDRIKVLNQRGIVLTKE